MADDNVSRLGIASAVVKALGSVSKRLVTSPFKGDNGANTYFKDVALAGLRTSLANYDLAADRYLNGNTMSNYLKYAKDNDFAPETTTLPLGEHMLWIGSKTATKVLVYFHGGGYVVPCSLGHMLWLDDLRKSMGPGVSAVILAYDLAPERTYPTQLRQATEFMRHLVQVEGRNPSDLILGGDSAGGNLVLSLLSHLAHPHPQVESLTLPAKFRGALLISPWCALTNTHTPAYTINAERDMFDRRALSRWAGAFLGSQSPFAGDFYSEPVLAAPEWWEPVADLVDEVLIWAGDDEILKDGIEAFAAKFTKGYGGRGGRVDTVITPKACHVDMIVARGLGYKGDGGSGSQVVVESWVKAKL
ncbi:hypothetical protein NX059_010976 [Plenodomus lindquistii]|nr:hypothetical protein NX059_010976 [Plenodomus lindquistii]